MMHSVPTRDPREQFDDERSEISFDLYRLRGATEALQLLVSSFPDAMRREDVHALGDLIGLVHDDAARIAGRFDTFALGATYQAPRRR